MARTAFGGFFLGLGGAGRHTPELFNTEERAECARQSVRSARGDSPADYAVVEVTVDAVPGVGAAGSAAGPVVDGGAAAATPAAAARVAEPLPVG